MRIKYILATAGTAFLLAGPTAYASLIATVNDFNPDEGSMDTRIRDLDGVAVPGNGLANIKYGALKAFAQGFGSNDQKTTMVGTDAPSILRNTSADTISVDDGWLEAYGSYDELYDLILASNWNSSFITSNGGTPATAEAVVLAGLGQAEAQGFPWGTALGALALLGLALGGLGFSLRKLY